MVDLGYFTRYTPGEYPGGYVPGAWDLPANIPASAWFGLDSRTMQRAYWEERLGFSLLPYTAHGSGFSWPGNSIPGDVQFPRFPFYWCFENSPATTKQKVLANNKSVAADLYKYLETIQRYSVTVEHRLALIKQSYMPVSQNGATVNISQAFWALLDRFVSVNGRMPEKIFSDYAGDIRLPAPVFERDDLGYKCPTWAAIPILAHIASEQNSVYSDAFVFTDDGPRITSNGVYSLVRHSFFLNAVSANIIPSYTVYEYGSVSDTGKVRLGYSFVYLVSDYSPAYVSENTLFFSSDLLIPLLNAYKEKMLAAENEAKKNNDMAHLFSLFTAVTLFLGLPALVTAIGNVYSGVYLYADILKIVKTADTLGIVEADKLTSVLKLGDVVYGMSQTAINTFSPATFTESAELDDAVTVNYTPPVIEGTNVSMIGFDWGDIPAGSGFDFTSDVTEYVPAYDWTTGFDWGQIPADAWGFGSDLGSDYVIDPIENWGGFSDYLFNPIEFGADLSADDLDYAAFDLAENVPGMSLVQFAEVNEINNQAYLDAQRILDESQKYSEATGQDFFGVLENVVKGTQSAAAAFLTLYSTYKKVEKTIQNGGQIPTTPTQTTRPTTPGQIVRQPDGSVSTMMPDGSIRTVRPNGSVVVTPPTSTMPSFNTIFSKQNLLIGGAVLGAGALVYVITSNRGK